MLARLHHEHWGTSRVSNAEWGTVCDRPALGRADSGLGSVLPCTQPQEEFARCILLGLGNANLNCVIISLAVLLFHSPRGLLRHTDWNIICSSCYHRVPFSSSLVCPVDRLCFTPTSASWRVGINLHHAA